MEEEIARIFGGRSCDMVVNPWEYTVLIKEEDWQVSRRRKIVLYRFWMYISLSKTVKWEAVRSRRS